MLSIMLSFVKRRLRLHYKGEAMAHQIYEQRAKKSCPRCGCGEVRIAIYHFGATYTAECAECAFGKSDGDNEAMAIARLHGIADL
jgi:hypothetical protein